MPFTGLDTTAIARSLSQIADRPDDVADAYVERLEEVEMNPEQWGSAARVRREEGLAVRLRRQGRSWISTTDELGPKSFMEALGHVARARPPASYSPPKFEVPAVGAAPDLAGMKAFPAALQRAIRRHHAAFPFRVRLRAHRRWMRVVGCRLAADQERETYFSCVVELPWGRHAALMSDLGKFSAEQVARSLLGLFRGREAPGVEAHRGVTVMAPAATAVILHEVVAHALETDTLAAEGHIEAAVGVKVGSDCLNVLDDPRSAPAGVRRLTDDEGVPTIRRWLLRAGVVEQPLADQASAMDSGRLVAGAGRRGSRHLPPVPRSSHLELLPSETAAAELLVDASEGLYIPEVSGGSLDPQLGRFTLEIPHARRIRAGRLGEQLGRFSWSGAVADLLDSVVAVGSDASFAGAGWCAKAGIKVPVWATCPSMRLEGMEFHP